MPHPHPVLSCVLSCAQELSSFLSTQTVTEMVVDRSAQNELVKVNFNIS